jgi:hypothetical protein
MKIYIAIDGDGVGTKLGQLIESQASDIQVRDFAQGVADEMNTFASRAKNLGATVVLCSGDSVLLSCKGNVSEILRGLKDTKKATYSAGTGRTAKEAALNLQYAKLNGKNQTWHFQKKKPFWLWLRIESPIRKLSKYAAGHF